MRIFTQPSKIVFGSGTFEKLPELLDWCPKPNPSVLYLVDRIHETTGLMEQLSLNATDLLIPVDTSKEPTTVQVDALVEQIKQHSVPDVIVGLGGGSILDISKATSVMLTNPGSSAEYQGWDLVKVPGVYKIGIPTISGTGSEASRTAVLTGPDKKFGINSDFSMFDAILLDPRLIETVPREQRFFTGMDCYIHSVEALSGSFMNTLGQGFASKALEYCENYFLVDPNNSELMTASYFGGCSVLNSEVGVCHALSYGLSLVLGYHHGIANCIVFNQLEPYYPEAVRKFRQMIRKHDIALPKQVTSALSSGEIERMVNMTFSMEKPLTNALGENWRDILTEERIKGLYAQM